MSERAVQQQRLLLQPASPLQMETLRHELGHSRGDCIPIWDSGDARFSRCAIPYIASIPLLIIAITLSLQVLIRSLQRWRPQWTRPFLVESVKDITHFNIVNGSQSWAIFMLILLAGSGITSFIVQLSISPRDPSHGILMAAWVIVGSVLVVQRPKTAPTHLTVFYLSVGAVEVLRALSGISSGKVAVSMHCMASLSAVGSLAVILYMRLRHPALPIDDISKVGSVPSNSKRSPEDNLRFWQFLSMSWMFPLIKVGKKRTLNEDDVWFLAYGFQHGPLYQKFSSLTGTVVQRLLKANGIDVCILTLSASVETVSEYMSPVVLQQLLAAMENQAPKRVALTYALIILFLRLVTAQSEVFNTWFGRRCYERSRGELILMVYEKALSRKNVIGVDPKLTARTLEQVGNGVPNINGVEALKKPALSFWANYCGLKWLFGKRQLSIHPENAKEPASMGKILNLCRGDVYEVAQRFWEIEKIVETVLGLVLSIVLIWKLLGPSCFIGVLVVVLGQVVNAYLTRIQLRIIKRMRGATDVRLQVTSQYIESIRHLRWYSWHEHWLKQIHEARDHELMLRVRTMIWQTIMNFTNMLTNGLFPVMALYGYTILGKHDLSIDIIFPALALFSMLSSNLRDVPQIITQLINAYIAMSRIEDFINEPDRTDEQDGIIGDQTAIQFSDCDLAWPGQSRAVLHSISITLGPGVHVVHGKVGAGKSAFLQALLGEMDKLAGTMHVPNEMIGYCSQSPWLQSMTIRDNILFSEEYDEWRYRNVLDACELLPDLASFEHGDLSPIGENGIGLSGGQKARVALARAVYSHARILLLDDPISALDNTTAENIVSKCFDGPLMKDRTLVLVTHRTELVQHLGNQFIEIQNGTASATGRNNDARTLAKTNGPKSNDRSSGHAVEDPSVQKLAEDAIPKKFEEEEHRAEFGVKARVYWQYVKVGKLKWWVLCTLTLATWRISSVAQTWFLKAWGEGYEQISPSLMVLGGLPDLHMFRSQHDLGSSYNTQSNPLTHLPPPGNDVKPWLLVYLAIATWIALASWLSQIFLVILTYVSSKSMFTRAITRVSQASFRFYDVTPVGRLMNRLTSDIGTVDGNIAQQFHAIVLQSISFASSLAVIASVTPAFLVFSICFVVFTVWIFSLFLPTSQSLRRLETVSLSPLFANFGELLHGLTTVRAFHAQQRFLSRIVSVVDNFQGMDHFYWTLQNWLAFRLQNMSAISTFILTYIAIYTDVSPGLFAFAITAAGVFVRATHVLCRRFGSLQMDFVAVERVDELLRLPEEPSGDIEPPASWPVFGSDIVLENVTAKYAPHLEPSLLDISMRIPGGSTTAILGRTGSGKSTLAVALLNVIRPESGRIIIDKIDISTISNKALRERVTFVAQDPVLFPGTIRHNLDPLEDHSDADCNEVLQRVCGRHGWTLETNIDAGGRNLSQGQRQLIGLARAILRRSSIVILDEATASIDYGSSMEIQQILREELRDATVITIAHRLQAVKDADYAVILDNRRVVRQGPAKDMLEQEEEAIDEATDASE